jgi:hypothetical protein
VPVIGSRCTGEGEGSAGDSYLGPGSWQVSVSYRHQLSHRHFVGTEEQKQRDEENSEVVNNINLFDLAVTYAINQRYSVTLSVPLFFAERYSQRAPDQRTQANGIGDISIVGRMWLIRPPAENKQNISIGLGIKIPTGKAGVIDTINTPAGPVTRAVDQSIQPGDGGTGLIADMQAFKVVGKATLFATGVYLFNPRNTNGVQTGRSRPSEAIMSVADQYLLRMGVVHPFPKVRGLAFGIGARGEGVPARDIFGESDGFRRPGYAIAVEPGFIYSRRRDVWSFSLPVAVRRNRIRSVPDIMDNRHGDAAFADYLILVGYSHRF